MVTFQLLSSSQKIIPQDFNQFNNDLARARIYKVLSVVEQAYRALALKGGIM